MGKQRRAEHDYRFGRERARTLASQYRLVSDEMPAVISALAKVAVTRHYSMNGEMRVSLRFVCKDRRWIHDIVASQAVMVVCRFVCGQILIVTLSLLMIVDMDDDMVRESAINGCFLTKVT